MDDSLSPLEREYARRLHALFMTVSPQKPEKGIVVLIRRARERAATDGVSLAEALESEYQAARQRTERRVELLKACGLANPKPGEADAARNEAERKEM